MLRSVKGAAVAIGLVAASFVAGGLAGAGVAVVVDGDDSTGVAAKEATGTSSVADAPARRGPRSPRRAQRDLRDALTAEKVFYTDELRYTDDLVALAPIVEGQDFTFGNGVAATEGRVVNVAVANDGQLLCLTASSTEGILVMTESLSEQDDERRFGPGPIDRCDSAAIASLPLDN